MRIPYHIYIFCFAYAWASNEHAITFMYFTHIHVDFTSWRKMLCMLYSNSDHPYSILCCFCCFSFFFFVVSMWVRVCVFCICTNNETLPGRCCLNVQNISLMCHTAQYGFSLYVSLSMHVSVSVCPCVCALVCDIVHILHTLSFSEWNLIRSLLLLWIKCGLGFQIQPNTFHLY